MTDMQAGDVLPFVGARYVAPASITGALYDIGEYPAATRSAIGEGSSIVGELWELSDPETIHLLDEYERYDPGDPKSLFRRETVMARRLDTATTQEAWAYLYAANRTLDRARR